MAGTATIAVLSASVGTGHERAAQALVAAAAELDPSPHLVPLDVVQLFGPLSRRLYAGGYARMVDHHPGLWGLLYRMTDRPKPRSRLNDFLRWMERVAAHDLTGWLRELSPDQVVCTHLLPAQYLARLAAKGAWDRPVWVVVTDFDCHRLWLNRGLTGYFVASDEVAFRMRERGLEGARVEVTGVPVMPEFGRSRDRAACAAEAGVDPGRTTFLMMAGGAGLSAMEAAVRRLLRLPGDFQIIALAGRSTELLSRLRSIAAGDGRLFPMGFTHSIERLMACSDVAITKSGGLTTSECLAAGLPMIVVSQIPGQEERNADYAAERGAALKAFDEATLAYRVDRVLSEPGLLEAMRQAAAVLGRPGAAGDILRTMLGAG